MSTLIKSKSDLQNVLRKRIEQKIQNALFLTAQQIYDEIQEHIVDYYNEPVFKNDPYDEPDVYQRTYKFLTSLVQPMVRKVGNAFECSVNFSDEYLKYHYPGNPNYKKNIPATGLDVIKWANDNSHGGTVSGNIEFWNDAIESLGGANGILNLLISNMKKQGIPFAK